MAHTPTISAGSSALNDGTDNVARERARRGWYAHGASCSGARSALRAPLITLLVLDLTYQLAVNDLFCSSRTTTARAATPSRGPSPISTP